MFKDTNLSYLSRVDPQTLIPDLCSTCKICVVLDLLKQSDLIWKKFNPVAGTDVKLWQSHKGAQD